MFYHDECDYHTRFARAINFAFVGIKLLRTRIVIYYFRSDVFLDTLRLYNTHVHNKMLSGQWVWVMCTIENVYDSYVYEQSGVLLISVQ